ncbi:hypothetical protein ACFYTQ_10055 [Nocardia sp. NPDC004068]|uniref:hypothetical protein n=1 Tax=Nocardia sp. NPDC004068 TaxID=3364303 RepID=UPI003676442C
MSLPRDPAPDTGPALVDAETLAVVASDPTGREVTALAARARAAGYRLTRDRRAPHWWLLRTKSTGAQVLSACVLAHIEAWLDT